MTGSVGIESLVLFLIIFLWTPPHFWALSLYKSDDYATRRRADAAGGGGRGRTKREILVYSVILTLFAAWRPLSSASRRRSTASLPAALGAVFVWLAWPCSACRRPTREMRPARRLFAFSMLYLFLLFAMLLVEGGVGRFVA